MSSRAATGLETRLSVAILGTRGYPSYYGGFETAVRKLAPALSDQGWDVTVYSRPGMVKEGDTTADPRVMSRTSWGIESRSLSTLTYGFSSAWLAMWRKPDVALVMNCANGLWLPLLAIRRIPTVVNVDGMEWERAKWGRVARLVFRWGARLSARFATTLVYDSVEIARRWESEFGRAGEFIPYGGDETTASLPLEPGLEHRRYALVVARLVPENSIDEFVDAARIVAKQAPVVIVGSSGYPSEIEDAVRELAATHDNVVWLGHVHDHYRLLSLWQHAGAYFHGHSVGGTNPALVQAMFCGAPIVARDTAYNREVLGDAGTYVRATAEEIASGILALLEDPRRQAQLSAAAHERARSAYGWPEVNARYEAVLRSSVGGTQSG